MANRNVKGRNQKFRNGTASSGVKKRLGRAPIRKGVVTDARQNILHKKRKPVLDARDVLSKMAKGQDARSKLLKIRGELGGGPSTRSNGNVRAIGTNILRKTDRNGKISLVTNKNKTPSNLNYKIQQQLGLVSNSRSNTTRSKKLTPTKRHQQQQQHHQRRYEPAAIQKTIQNEYSPSVLHTYSYDPHPDMYRWYSSGISPMLPNVEVRRPIGEVRASNNSSWRSYSSSARQPYIDLDAVDDEEMPMMTSVRPGMQRPPSNIHSRLDAQPSNNQTHGILSQAKTKVVVPIGHRIVVSNLQSTVTQDDIRELFEDIGQLLVARLVRPGTAEVIYKNLKDAQKAVDTYHNRQLDGQPMKCLLVNKRPSNNPTAPALKHEGILAMRKLPTVTATSANKLVPDISTIHKVLFQRN